jgi:hypothetical protein
MFDEISRATVGLRDEDTLVSPSIPFYINNENEREGQILQRVISLQLTGRYPRPAAVL